MFNLNDLAYKGENVIKIDQSTVNRNTWQNLSLFTTALYSILGRFRVKNFEKILKCI